jgi:aminocarboxymuconate-semialdehyde decarboxylase
VELTPGIDGRYLGEDAFWPFWEVAEETGAVLFIHPATRGLALPVFEDYYLWNSVANPVETAIAAAHLVMAGVLERYPALKIVLAHGGGALWAIRGRLRRAYSQVPAARSRLRDAPDASLARLGLMALTQGRPAASRSAASAASSAAGTWESGGRTGPPDMPSSPAQALM